MQTASERKEREWVRRAEESNMWEAKLSLCGSKIRRDHPTETGGPEGTRRSLLARQTAGADRAFGPEHVAYAATT